MKKFWSTLTVLAAVALFALGYHFYGGAKVPAGQPPLVSLKSTNFDQLRAVHSMPHLEKSALFCCFLQHDQRVCGGLPQFKMF